MRKHKRAPKRIYPEGFQMDREEFMFRCFMSGATKIHERLSDKRVKLNIHNGFDWKNIRNDYTGRGFVYFNVKMGSETNMYWDDWENECKKLKMRWRIFSPSSFKQKYYTIRLEW